MTARGAIRYMVTDAGKWLPGCRGPVSPPWIESISWPERQERSISRNRGAREVRSSTLPNPVSREYEVRFYDYYGRLAY